MAKYAHIDVLEGGLNVIKNQASKMLLIKAYAANDSYATVVGNKIAEVAMAPGDYALSGGDGAPHVLTVVKKDGVPATAPSGATPDLHVALTDGVSRVLAVTKETSNQSIPAGNNVNIPSFTYTSNQPI